jgi:hypothetical protein
VPAFPTPPSATPGRPTPLLAATRAVLSSRDGDSVRAFGSPAAQEAERAAIRRSSALTRFAAAATARAWRRAALSRIPRSSRPTRPISGARLCSPAIAQSPGALLGWRARRQEGRKHPVRSSMKRLAPQSVPCLGVSASTRSPRFGVCCSLRVGIVGRRASSKEPTPIWARTRGSSLPPDADRRVAASRRAVVWTQPTISCAPSGLRGVLREHAGPS